MAKFSKKFLEDGELLFVGYSLNNNAFSKSIYEAISNHGIKVYPVNPKADGNHPIKVYKDLTELPKIPKNAYLLLKPSDMPKAVEDLGKKGIKKILVQGKLPDDVAKQCSTLGIEAAGGCPMMVFGGGLHKFHGFLAGVR